MQRSFVRKIAHPERTPSGPSRVRPCHPRSLVRQDDEVLHSRFEGPPLPGVLLMQVAAAAAWRLGSSLFMLDGSPSKSEGSFLAHHCQSKCHSGYC
ncbi:hypothetical protein COCOBI_10-1900 [Coccomyxa sp. Obi]|nr:hypothetical protein COCOBI_10-1900 [Coccomyxa sp. Obi]